MRQRTAAQLESSFRQFVAGDDAGFLVLYEHYNPRFGIYTMKRYRLSFVEAEDVLQTMWERVLKLRAKGSLAEIENFGAFLFRALTNEAVDTLRRRRETVSIDTVESNAADDAAASETPFAKMNAYVLAAFDALSDEHREVLILQLYCGYELSEIADMLQKSRDAIWARASRARNELRKRVAELAARKNIALSEFKVLAS
jgi:RNA polymerase sigma-70 factor (ECF subfamily)